MDKLSVFLNATISLTMIFGSIVFLIDFENGAVAKYNLLWGSYWILLFCGIFTGVSSIAALTGVDEKDIALAKMKNEIRKLKDAVDEIQNR